MDRLIRKLMEFSRISRDERLLCFFKNMDDMVNLFHSCIEERRYINIEDLRFFKYSDLKGLSSWRSQKNIGALSHKDLKGEVHHGFYDLTTI